LSATPHPRSWLAPAEWQLALPLALFFVGFFVAPLVGLAIVSLYGEPSFRSIGLSQYARFFGDTFNLGILFDTLLLGAKATLVCLVFGYPLAWLCVTGRPWLSRLLLFIVILPILTSVIVRTFAWIVILGRQGILNKAFVALGLSDGPVALLFTEPGIVIVLAQVQMPLMVLPLLTNLQRIDGNLADASAALGAGAWRTFRRVILPLSVPGIAAGCTLVYAACVTAFITQTLIGGARHLYMPLFIYQQATGANDWPFAAAVAIVFMAAVLLVVYLLNLLGRVRGAQLYA
jgi:putative spermidine/putrescine transport system permease protein